MKYHGSFKRILGWHFRFTRALSLFAFLLVCFFIADGASTALAVDAPQLISPTNFSHTTGNPNDPNAGRVLFEPLGIPTFEWKDIGASKYKLEVATTSAFGDSVVLSLNNLKYSTFTPFGQGELGTGFSLTEESGNFSDTATFYWHVQAWDDTLGQWSNWSSTWSFTRHWGNAVDLSYPANLSVEKRTPYFEWEPVPGASFYQIQVDTSDSFGSLLINVNVDVPNYTPINTLQNDTDLFWRVRAFHRPNVYNVNGGYGGPWSEVREFQLAWSSKVGGTDNRPLQLMPPDNATYIARPLFCWQPVEGANKYRLDLSNHPDFVTNSFIFKDRVTEGTCYHSDRDRTFDLDPDTTYYWRVTALDARGFPGQSTDTGVGSAAFQFRTAPIEIPTKPPKVPTHLYPYPYYEPIMDDTFEDRTVAVPTFVWDHVRGATSYELRLDDDAALTDPPIEVINTNNASYTFTDADTYPLNDGQIYYWRVRAQGTPDWNQMLDAWPVRIDRSLVEVDADVKLIQPTYQEEPWTSGYKYGQESVTYYPSMSWTAVAPIGEVTYQVQIAVDSDFANLIHEAQTDFVEYTPTDRPEPGTYFWRVGHDGIWSEAKQFIVSRNFTFVNPGGIVLDGDASDWVASAVPFYSPSGENGDANSTYDMSGMYVANDGYNWYFGIDLPPNADLGLYFDIDHFNQSGSAQPPAGEGGNPNSPEAHLPEFAVYWSNSQPLGQVYEWGGASWVNRGTLGNILANAVYSTTTELLELQIPVTQLDQPGSLSTLLFSMDSGGVIQDRLPNLPNEPTKAGFLTDSTTPTPLYPANAPEDASLVTIEHNTPVLTWRHNEAGYSGTFFFQTFQDETLSNYYEGENGNVPNLKWAWAYNTYWAPTIHYSDNNSYHWRIQRSGFEGANPLHFQKEAFVPTNLEFSPLIVSDSLTYTNRTPSFTWQPAQSAPRYVWQLWESGVLRKQVDTMVPYYTPNQAIEDGTYIWKVYAKDARSRLSAVAAQGEFRKVSDIVPVTGVEYENNKLVFRWEPVDFAAYYGIEIADDPQFSKNRVFTLSYNTTFTPISIPRATEDGTFYWRVFMFDNRNNAGPYIDLNFDLLSEKIYLPLTIR